MQSIYISHNLRQVPFQRPTLPRNRHKCIRQSGISTAQIASQLLSRRWHFFETLHQFNSNGTYPTQPKPLSCKKTGVENQTPTLGDIFASERMENHIHSTHLTCMYLLGQFSSIGGWAAGMRAGVSLGLPCCVSAGFVLGWFGLAWVCLFLVVALGFAWIHLVIWSHLSHIFSLFRLSWFHWVRLGVTWSDWVALSFAWFDLVSLGLTWSHLAHSSMHAPIRLSFCLSVCWSIFLLLYPSIHQSVYLSIYVSIPSLIRLSIYLCIYLSIHLSIYP